VTRTILSSRCLGVCRFARGVLFAAKQLDYCIARTKLQDGSKHVVMTLPLPNLQAANSALCCCAELALAGATPLARVLNGRACARTRNQTKPDATAKAELRVAYIVTSVEFQAIAIQYQHSTALPGGRHGFFICAFVWQNALESCGRNVGGGFPDHEV
jgi:hypothetical protein